MRETIVSSSPVLAQLVRHVVDLAGDERDALEEVQDANKFVFFFKKTTLIRDHEKKPIILSVSFDNFPIFQNKRQKSAENAIRNSKPTRTWVPSGQF